MSRGRGAYAELICVDNEQIVYKYWNYNDEQSDSRKDRSLAGEICIKRDEYEKLLYHANGKWKPNKNQRKTMRADASLFELYKKGAVIIKKDKQAWLMDESGMDRMALRLLGVIEMDCKKGILPATAFWNS